MVYYASRKEIYALHPTTKHRVRIASLTFAPQCLGAGHGWICAGSSEAGKCAFIDIKDSTTAAALDVPGYGSRRSEVDELLPLDLEFPPRTQGQALSYRYATEQGPPWLRAKVYYRELGKLIVNSITVHKIQSRREGVNDEVVAVVTNNDQTISIYSLSQSRVLFVLNWFPTPMNHAAISPDGGLLLACGDEPRAFFAQRRELPGLSVDGEAVYAKYDWQELSDRRLTDVMSVDTCFATAFSPSGHICAVASQTGVINVFDVQAIRDEVEGEDAVIEVLESTRTQAERDDLRGAIRSMAFGPRPWDLFAWAEDRGRICIADLRNRFRTRQTIELDWDSHDVNRVGIRDPEEEIFSQETREPASETHHLLLRQQVLLDSRDSQASFRHAADFLERAAERLHQREQEDSHEAIYQSNMAQLGENERRRSQSARRESALDESPNSTLAERERQRRYLDPDPYDQIETEGGRPFSLHYLPPATSAPPPAPSTLAPPSPFIRQYVREHHLDRSRAWELRNQPRRRSSVVVSNTNNSSSANVLLPPTFTSPFNRTTSPSRLPIFAAGSNRNPSTLPSAASLPISPASTDPWETISAAMATASSSGGTSAAPDAVARFRRERDTRVRERGGETERVHVQEVARARLRGRERAFVRPVGGHLDTAISDTPNQDRRLSLTPRGDTSTTGSWSETRPRTPSLRQLQERGSWAGADGVPALTEHQIELLRRLGDESERQIDMTSSIIAGGVGIMGLGWRVDGTAL